MLVLVEDFARSGQNILPMSIYSFVIDSILVHNSASSLLSFLASPYNTKVFAIALKSLCLALCSSTKNLSRPIKTNIKLHVILCC